MCASFERLSQIYSHLFLSQNSDAGSSDVVKSLLEVCPGRDVVLLQLSILRRIFSEANCPPTLQQQEDGSHGCGDGRSLRDVVCKSLIASPSLVPWVVEQLKGGDQMVSFCASKAICAILLHPHILIKLEWLSAILMPVSPGRLSDCVATYSLQLFSELLKELRKKLSTSLCEQEDTLLITDKGSYVEKRSVCFLVMETSWSVILREFTDCISNSGGKAPHQVDLSTLESPLGEFLSLTVEILRHSGYTSIPCELQEYDNRDLVALTASRSISGDDEACLGLASVEPPSDPETKRPAIDWEEPGKQTVTTPMSSCQRMVVSHLQSLSSLLQTSTSPFLLKKMLDIFLKVIGGQFALVNDAIQELSPSLEQVLQSTVICSVVDSWMQVCGLSYVKSALREIEGAQSSVGDEDPAPGPVSLQDCGLLNTVARKLVLLLLQCTAAQVHSRDHSWKQPMGALQQLIRRSLSSADLVPPQNRVPHLVRSVALRVLSEQDDCLVEALLACCRIHQGLKTSTGSPEGYSTWYCEVFDIHTVFVEFMASITFDHSVLLDFLVSPETRFPEFLREYLKLTVATESEWDSLKLACAEYWLSPGDDEGQAEGTLPGEFGNASNASSSTSASNDDKSPTSAASSSGSIQDFHATNTPLGSHESLSLTAGFLPKAKRPNRQESPDTNLSYLLLLTEECSPCETDSDMDSYGSTGEELLMDDSHDNSSSDHGGLEASGDDILQEPCLDRIMGCCIRLKYTLERLLSKALLPNLSVSEEIVRLLEGFEDRYEK